MALSSGYRATVEGRPNVQSSLQHIAHALSAKFKLKVIPSFRYSVFVFYQLPCVKGMCMLKVVSSKKI